MDGKSNISLIINKHQSDKHNQLPILSPSRKMKCVSAQNLLNSVSPVPKTSNLLSNNHLQLHSLGNKKHRMRNHFADHISLTRTTSAPLKTDDATDSKTSKSGAERNSSSSHNNYFNIFSPKVWKRSFLKMNDDKGGSRFSLRRTFSLRSSNSNGETGGHISFPSSKHKKKRQRYKIVEAKTGQADGISFELVNKQGCFLRVKGSELIPDRDNGSDSNFNKDVTFVPLPDMWFASFFAFESVSKPSYFIRLLPEEELVLDKYDGTKDFKKDASFSLSRKPDATILKKDVQAWVKSTTGEYYLGKIVFVNDDIVKVEFTDGRQERCLRAESFKLIPDIVPCPTNLRIGVRVISQFGHRHRFYPGVISSIRRNDSYDILFDDGDCGRGKSYQMRLMQNFPIHEDEDTLTSNKESTHAPVKLVFSDPGGIEGGNWCKYQNDCSPSSSTQFTGVTSLGEMSPSPTNPSIKFHKDTSDNNYSIDNNNTTIGDTESEKRNINNIPSILHQPWKMTDDQEDNDYNIIATTPTPGTNGSCTSHIPRRKHGWVQSSQNTDCFAVINGETKSTSPLLHNNHRPLCRIYDKNNTE